MKIFIFLAFFSFFFQIKTSFSSSINQQQTSYGPYEIVEKLRIIQIQVLTEFYRVFSSLDIPVITKAIARDNRLFSIIHDEFKLVLLENNNPKIARLKKFCEQENYPYSDTIFETLRNVELSFPEDFWDTWRLFEAKERPGIIHFNYLNDDSEEAIKARKNPIKALFDIMLSDPLTKECNFCELVLESNFFRFTYIGSSNKTNLALLAKEYIDHLAVEKLKTLLPYTIIPQSVTKNRFEMGTYLKMILENFTCQNDSQGILSYANCSNPEILASFHDDIKFLTKQNALDFNFEFEGLKLSLGQWRLLFGQKDFGNEEIHKNYFNSFVAAFSSLTNLKRLLNFANSKEGENISWSSIRVNEDSEPIKYLLYRPHLVGSKAKKNRFLKEIESYQGKNFAEDNEIISKILMANHTVPVPTIDFSEFEELLKSSKPKKKTQKKPKKAPISIAPPLTNQKEQKAPAQPNISDSKKQTPIKSKKAPTKEKNSKTKRTSQKSHSCKKPEPNPNMQGFVLETVEVKSNAKVAQETNPSTPLKKKKRKPNKRKQAQNAIKAIKAVISSNKPTVVTPHMVQKATKSLAVPPKPLIKIHPESLNIAKEIERIIRLQERINNEMEQIYKKICEESRYRLVVLDNLKMRFSKQYQLYTEIMSQEKKAYSKEEVFVGLMDNTTYSLDSWLDYLNKHPNGIFPCAQNFAKSVFDWQKDYSQQQYNKVSRFLKDPQRNFMNLKHLNEILEFQRNFYSEQLMPYQQELLKNLFLINRKIEDLERALEYINKELP